MSNNIKQKSPKILEKQEKKRNHIIWSTFNVIAALGYINLTIEDVAKEAGISKGGVHYYFETKDDLMFEVMDAFIEFFIISLIISVPEPDKPIERLQEIIKYSMKIAINHKEYVRVVIDYLAQSNTNPKFREVFQHNHELIILHFKELIDRAKEMDLVKNIDSESVAEIILGGLGSFALRYRRNENATEENMEKKINLTVESLMLLLLK